jgi:hypothetical protein
MTTLRFEIREFTGSSFGEAHEWGYGNDVEDFESYVAQFTDDPHEETARPFRGIVAARRWESPNTRGGTDPVEMSAFAYRNDED